MTAAPTQLDLRRCGLCGDRIGIYEPLVILLRGGELVRTSLAVSPHPERRGFVFHAACDAPSQPHPDGDAE